MTPAEQLIRDTIARDGPIGVDRFMELALYHPEHGYYRCADPLGATGDFITAPEISQVFGELIGLWCAVVWQSMGAPRPVRLVELGPGRGTLMRDALRAARVVPAFLEAAALHLVETSPALRQIQAATLAGPDVEWHETFDDVPPGPVIVVANELFDALPVHQFEMTEAGWRERLVAADGPDDSLHFVTAETSAAVPALPADDPVGAIRETCPAGGDLITAIARRLAADGGAALIVDYGPARSGPGETLQSVRGHRHHDPLRDPGAADLTAHVDFQALAAAAKAAGAATHGPVTQQAFLTRLGIEARAAKLIEAASPDEAILIRSACRRLIDPAEMGTLFKVLALTHPALAVPPGFEDGAETGGP